MASSWIAPSSLQQLQQEALCVICMDYYKDPVSVTCGHNYCRTCVSQMWAKEGTMKEEQDGAPENAAGVNPITQEPELQNKQMYKFSVGDTLLYNWFSVDFQLSWEEEREAQRKREQEKGIGGVHLDGVSRAHPENLLMCPQCGVTFKDEDFRPNLQLANMTQIINQLCSIYRTRKLLRQHMCPKHQEALKLFCEVDEEVICLVCRDSRRHKQHSVVPLDEKFRARRQIRENCETWQSAATFLA